MVWMGCLKALKMAFKEPILTTKCKNLRGGSIYVRYH